MLNLPAGIGGARGWRFPSAYCSPEKMLHNKQDLNREGRKDFLLGVGVINCKSITKLKTELLLCSRSLQINYGTYLKSLHPLL